MTYENDTKAYEERLQRRLKTLKESIDQGKIHIHDPHTLDSLLAVRYGPDGKVDLSTVNGAVRVLALLNQASRERQESKASMPLRNIQETYFKFIENNFGEYYRIMKKRGLTPHDAGRAASKDPSTVESISSDIAAFVETIEAFWNDCSEAAVAHVEDMQGTLKGIYGGDMFPSYKENIASKCGIYVDTIILPDPFLRSTAVFSQVKPREKAYYFIKHALNLLQYRELACADLPSPIVIVVPDRMALERRERDFIFETARKDSLIHASRVFGREFESFEDLMEFAEKLDSIDKVKAEVKNPSRVLFDCAWPGDIEEQISRARAKRLGMDDKSTPGEMIALEALGRMAMSNQILVRSRALSGTPVIDAPTSWQYFSWKLEYDAEQVELEGDLKDLYILRGLQRLARDEMIWLGHVPEEALIEIRRSGALDDIRHMLGKGIEEIAKANPTNFHRAADQIFDNIHEAFGKHQAQMKQLSSKKWKFAKDISSWLAVGSLTVAAAATGNALWGLAAFAVNQLADVPKAKEIPKSLEELIEQSKKVKLSPVGLLFQYKK